MLIKFILAIIVLTVLISKPILLLVAVAVGIILLVLSGPGTFTRIISQQWPDTVPNDIESEEDLSRDFKEYDTPEEIYAREVESKMKPGYKDDPKWKGYDDKIKAHNEWIRTNSAADGTMEDNLDPSLEELTSEVV